MAGAGAPEGVGGEFFVAGVVVAPPADAAVAGSAGIGSDLVHGVFAEELFAIPIAFAKHEPADVGARAGGVVAAAPGADQGKAIDGEGLRVADGPFAVGHPDGA